MQSDIGEGIYHLYVFMSFLYNGYYLYKYLNLNTKYTYYIWLFLGYITIVVREYGDRILNVRVVFYLPEK